MPKTVAYGHRCRPTVEEYTFEEVCLKSVFRFVILVLAIGLVACANPPAPASNAPVTLRVGYFPNITHAQAVIGIADGTFQSALGNTVTIDAKIFNAGPRS